MLRLVVAVVCLVISSVAVSAFAEPVEVAREEIVEHARRHSRIIEPLDLDEAVKRARLEEVPWDELAADILPEHITFRSERAREQILARVGFIARDADPAYLRLAATERLKGLILAAHQNALLPEMTEQRRAALERIADRVPETAREVIERHAGDAFPELIITQETQRLRDELRGFIGGELTSAMKEPIDAEAIDVLLREFDERFERQAEEHLRRLAERQHPENLQRNPELRRDRLLRGPLVRLRAEVTQATAAEAPGAVDAEEVVPGITAVREELRERTERIRRRRSAERAEEVERYRRELEERIERRRGVREGQPF